MGRPWRSQPWMKILLSAIWRATSASVTRPPGTNAVRHAAWAARSAAARAGSQPRAASQLRGGGRRRGRGGGASARDAGGRSRRGGAAGGAGPGGWLVRQQPFGPPPPGAPRPPAQPTGGRAPRPPRRPPAPPGAPLELRVGEALLAAGRQLAVHGRRIGERRPRSRHGGGDVGGRARAGGVAPRRRRLLGRALVGVHQRRQRAAGAAGETGDHWGWTSRAPGLGSAPPPSACRARIRVLRARWAAQRRAGRCRSAPCRGLGQGGAGGARAGLDAAAKAMNPCRLLNAGARRGGGL
jgi:hypothetical protein